MQELLKIALEDSSPPEYLSVDGFPAPKDDKQIASRRIRLGAKKRVVFQLIKQGIRSQNDLVEKLRNSDVDARYIRDVVRQGVEEGDIEIDPLDGLTLSKFGEELLSKANLPVDWSKYADLLTNEASVDIFD